MTMGYLSLLVTEIPKWISIMVKSSEIDFSSFEHFRPRTTAEIVRHFDENLKEAKRAFSEVSDGQLDEPFYLKNEGKVLVAIPKKTAVMLGIASVSTP
jgi:hypothetical protein